MLFLMRADTAAATAAFHRQQHVDPDGDFLLYSRILLERNVRGAVAPVPLDSTPLAAGVFFGLTTGFDVLPVDVAYADSILAHFARRGTRDFDAERQVAWNTGRPSRLASTIRGGESPRVLAEYVQAGLLWDGDAGAAGRSAAAIEQWLRDNPGGSLTTDRMAAWFATGLWAFNRGDTVQVERSRRAIASLRSASMTPAQRTARDIQEQLLAAHLAVGRKRADAGQRLQRLDSMLIDARGFDARTLMSANSLLAELWERAGEPQRTLDAGRRIEFGVNLAWLASTRARREARLLERVGRPAEAIVRLREYVAMREKAELPLRTDLADAKATLARLEKQAR